MTSPQPITAAEFSQGEGVGDWRVVSGAAQSRYRTGSFTKGVEFIVGISALAEAANHHPDVELRYGSVTIRLITHSTNSLSDFDLALAQQISSLAGELGIAADIGE